MEYAAYYVIHDKVQPWLDSQKRIKRKKLFDFLRYFHIKKENWRTKFLIIKDMIEIGLFKKINHELYEWIPNKKTRAIYDDRYISLKLVEEYNDR